MNTLDHPYHFDRRGRTASTGLHGHIRDLIEQVLLTSPGERVMRPDFGAGILALVFEPNSSLLAATTQALVQSALQQHLSELIRVGEVTVANDEGALRVDVRYVVLADGSTQQTSLTVPGGAP